MVPWNILVKFANYPLLHCWMNNSNFRGMQRRREWPLDCKFGKPMILAWLSLTLAWVIFRISSTSGLIMDQVCQQLLHVFSVNLGVILNQFFCRSLLCDICWRLDLLNPFIKFIEIMNSVFSHIVKSPLRGISREHMLENNFKRAIAELYDSSVKGAIARNKK